MSNSHALIVDDSKTAQLRLKRMLEAYDLHIDVVSSAEEALAYLSYRAPAVIFLDQSMKGMDGIEALKTIKANPATAMIPVIMYTSEKGNVFTGQARALGALDILYKSSLKPSSLENVLRALKIAPSKKPRSEPPPPPAPSEAPAADTPQHPALSEIRGQIARLFEIHIADVGRQIDKSTQFLGRRIAAVQEQSRNTPAEIVVGDVPLSVLNDEVSAERRRIALVSNTLLCVLLVGLVGLAALLWQFRYWLDDVEEDYQNTIAMTEMNATQIQEMSADVYARQGDVQTAGTDSQLLLEAITWATNADLGFAHGEEPLNEDFLGNLKTLAYLLADAGFRGIVEVRLNFGNTCMAYNDSGVLDLAPDDLPIGDCLFRESLDEEFPETDYLSLPFLNFENQTPPLRDGNIDVMVSSIGLDQPRVQYPRPAQLEAAGQWNALALQNNYVSLAFHSVD